MRYWNWRTITVNIMMVAFVLVIMNGCASWPEFSHECATVYDTDSDVQTCEAKVSERNDRIARKEAYEDAMDAARAVCHEAGKVPLIKNPSRGRYTATVECISRQDLRDLMYPMGLTGNDVKQMPDRIRTSSYRD